MSVSEMIIRWMRSSAQPTVTLPRSTKIAVAITTDICLCILATWFAFYLRLDIFVELNNELAKPVFLSIALALPIFATTGLYRTIFRHSGCRQSSQLLGL